MIARAELIATWLVGDRPEPETPGTVAELLERWYALRSDRWKPTTRDTYRHAVDRAKRHIGHLEAAKVRPADLEDAYQAMLRHGSSTGGPVSAKTVGHSHGVISAAYTFAIRRSELTFNPATVAETPKVENRRLVIPDDDTIMRLLASVQSPLWRPAFLRIGLATGIRRSEILGLRWSDIDLERLESTRTWYVTATSSGPHVAEGSKTGPAPRVSWGEGTADAIRRLMTAQKKTALAAGVSLVDDPWLFSRTGTPDASEPMPPSTVDSWWRRLAAKTPGLEDVHWHDIRAYTHTVEISEGIDVDAAARRAGQTDGTTMLRRYKRWVPASDRAAADVMTRRLDGQV